MNFTDEKDIHVEVPEVEIAEPKKAAPAPEEESYKNQFLRLSADFANYKRRSEKERGELLSMGQAAIIRAFLPLVDDIERALMAARQVADSSSSEGTGLKSVIDGLSLVEKNMCKVLEDVGVQEIACSGSFNPEQHEALMQVAGQEGLESGAIVQVLSKGYTHKGSVIRHAKVSVAA